MMNIGIIFRKVMKEHPIEDIAYKPFYEILSKVALKKGVRLYIDSYKRYKDGKFTQAFFYDAKEKKWKKEKNIKLDLVYDKCVTDDITLKAKKKIEREVPFINPLEFELKIYNKYILYKQFKDIMPLSLLVKSRQDIKRNLKKIKTEKYVLKPCVGYGGFKIRILNKKDPIPHITSCYVLQPLIDTSGGIPNLIKGVHDLRIVLINHKIIYSYLRVPRKGSLLCNVHQGGRMITISNRQIPKKVLKIVNKIRKKFINYKYVIYSTDFFFENGKKPYLVEMNSKPHIMFNKEDRKLMFKFYNILINNLKKAAKSS